MKLIHATLRPARVIEVLGHGEIKVEAPGIFAEGDKEFLPTVMPWPWAQCNAYSEPLIDDEVWLLNMEDNPMQLFWFRKDSRQEDTADKGDNIEIETETNVEILCNRKTGSGYATIYFSDGTGWMFRKNSSFVNIRADGSIVLDANVDKRVIDICGDSISLGKVGGSSHHAVYGEELTTCLNNILSALNAIRNGAMTSAFTAAIATCLQACPGFNMLDQNIGKITSPNVTLE